MSLNLEKQLTFVSLVTCDTASACMLSICLCLLGQPLLVSLNFTLLFILLGNIELELPANLSLQYGAYHSNQVNVIIHMICVPLILFSAFEIV